MDFVQAILKDKNDFFRYLAAAMTVLLLAGLSYWAPNQAEVVLFKVCLVSLACLVGYWIDKILFPNYQISDFRRVMDDEQWSDSSDYHLPRFMLVAQIRRAIILFAAVVGVCLGL